MDKTIADKSTNEIAVGSFTLLAIIILLCGWIWLKEIHPFAYAKHYQVKFHDVSGLHVKAGVKLNGVGIGTVEAMKLNPDGTVLVGFRINSQDVTLRQNAVFSVAAASPIAAKGLAKSMPPPQAGMPPSAILDSNTIANGQDSVPLDALVNKLADTLNKIDAGGLRQQLGVDMSKMAKAAENVSSTSKKFGQVANRAIVLTDKANALSGDIKATAAGIKSAAGQMDTVGKQMSQMLDKRHPLMHMMVGRPGHLKPEPPSKQSQNTQETTPGTGVQQIAK